MGSSEEMEKLWIHGALNVCVNDQSQQAGVGEQRLEERKRESEGEKLRERRENQGEALIYSG